MESLRFHDDRLATDDTRWMLDIAEPTSARDIASSSSTSSIDVDDGQTMTRSDNCQPRVELLLDCTTLPRLVDVAACRQDDIGDARLQQLKLGGPTSAAKPPSGMLTRTLSKNDRLVAMTIASSTMMTSLVRRRSTGGGQCVRRQADDDVTTQNYDVIDHTRTSSAASSGSRQGGEGGRQGGSGGAGKLLNERDDEETSDLEQTSINSGFIDSLARRKFFNECEFILISGKTLYTHCISTSPYPTIPIN